jgi:hypothetical protein
VKLRRHYNLFSFMSLICDGSPFFDGTGKEALVIVQLKLARFCFSDRLPAQKPCGLPSAGGLSWNFQARLGDLTTD